MAKRSGADNVYCVYRRTRDESPARLEEIEHTEEEDIIFQWLTQPLEILDDGEGNVRAMRCMQMELGEPDDSGRRRPEPIEGSEFEFETDMVVYAIGTNANPILGQTSKLALNQWGYIEVDDNFASSIAGVYAGGDIVTGAATVILAMGTGRKAARAMKTYLGITGTDEVYESDFGPSMDKLFGMDVAQKNFARVRLSTVDAAPASKQSKRAVGA